MQVLWVMRLKLRYHTEVNKRHFSRTSLELVQSEFLLVLKWLFFHLACSLKSPFKRQLSPSLLHLPRGQLKAVAGASHLDSLVWFKGPQALKAMASTRLRKGNKSQKHWQNGRAGESFPSTAFQRADHPIILGHQQPTGSRLKSFPAFIVSKEVPAVKSDLFHFFSTICPSSLAGLSSTASCATRKTTTYL